MKLKSFLIILFLLQSFSYAQGNWYVQDSEHFKFIYKKEHSRLAVHILQSAEKSLRLLSSIFNYTPSEKIIINTYDIYDYGFASATTVPENFIRIEIEPFEPGYENIPYTDRFQWIISHELVHIVLNDQASPFEKFSRSLFAKVAPEQVQPLTIFYSLLSNYSRYTPRWHQESSAVFLETWMNGGFGRVLGSFDEMYFRSLVFEEKDFCRPVSLDAVTSHRSFLVESLFYTYGGRFAAYLAKKFGSEKLAEWYKVNDDFYPSIKERFEETFESEMNDEWEEFIKNEISFQKKNIERIQTVSVTQIRNLSTFAGWVTDPYITADTSIIFGMHKPKNLAALSKLNYNDGSIEEIASLPTPSMYQITSLSYDSSKGFLFYTTNNNQLYRDVWVYDTKSGDKKELFPDVRIGQMSVCPSNGDFWGIQHSSGTTSIVFSEFPYNSISVLYALPVPDEFLQLKVSPYGDNLAAVIHTSDGSQKLVVIDAHLLKNKKEFKYNLVSDAGGPENPSWSPDGETLLWNAYINGVSNIYRKLRSSEKPEALTNTVRGLFKPVMFGKDSIFVFEFSTEGFIPSVIANKPAERLFAITYFGQEVLYRNPNLTSLTIPATYDTGAAAIFSSDYRYNGLANLKIQTFIPVISGFQNQKVLGILARISDPLLNHDITFEGGYSPFNENPAGPKFHAKFKYEYLKRFEIGIDYNAPDFYDLFNTRKRGTIGTKLRTSFTNYWLFDNPHKIKQVTELALYTDFQYINDNLVRVTEPDFGVAQTVWNSKNLRRTIGSSDFEHGDDITATVMVFGSEPKTPKFAAEIHGEWDKYMLFLVPHNVLHYKIAAGYHHKNEKLMQALFYFGGFGNREVENTDVKQYRSVFRFPGIPMYSVSAEQFLKIMIENSLPPLRFSNASVGQHYLSHIDISLYSQGLMLKNDGRNKWINAGAQINFLFKHWFNLESTFSAGIARAWAEKYNDWEWFLSYKLLRN